MTEPADRGRFAPILEQEIRLEELGDFREMARQFYEDELDSLRERRGEFDTEAEPHQHYANAAMRACAQAAAMVLVRRDFEEAVRAKPRIRRRRR